MITELYLEKIVKAKMVKYQFEDVSPTRSKTMKAIRGKNTSIELKLRSALHKRGLRFRIHYKKLPGSPDIVFVSKKVAIFCDGDFWHGKNWQEKKEKIKTRRDYWIPKIERNIQSDKENRSKFKEMDWTVLAYWDNDIKKNLEVVVKDILGHLK